MLPIVHTSNRCLESLKSAKEFGSVIEGAATLRVRSVHLELFVSPRSEGHRLGLIVSKRCYPRAVDRNRAKRLLREYARLYVRAYPPLNVIVRFRQPIHSLTFSAVSACLDALFLKVRSRLNS